jgi:DNA-directed RNA polymerase specialized sigma24 family protein
VSGAVGEGDAAAVERGRRDPSPRDLQRGEPPDNNASDGVTDHDLQEDTDLATRRDGEQLQRRLADARLVAELAESGFTGPGYEQLQAELVRYGWAVMDAWLRRGFIFGLCARMGRPVRTTDALRHLLAEDAEERAELAAAAVAATIGRFREDALVGGGWSAAGGASLATYFVNAVVREFPNEYRRWMRATERWRRAFVAEGSSHDPAANPVTDPAVLASDRLGVLADLRRLKPREQQIVALTIDGYSQVEIVEVLGLGSVREVEGVLYRWRTREKRRRRRETGR